MGFFSSLVFPKAFSLKPKTILFLVCFWGILQSLGAWGSSLLLGLETADREKRLVLVYIYADWCNYCKTLESEVFPDPDVQKALSEFVLVRIDGERFPNFKERYQVGAYPSLLFLDGKAQSLYKLTGLTSKKETLDFFREFAGISNLETYLLRLRTKDPEASLTHYRLGLYYRSISQENKAKEAFEKALLSKKEASKQIRSDTLFELAMSLFHLEDWTGCDRRLVQFLELHPRKERAITAKLFRGLAKKEMGEKLQAKRILEQILPETRGEEEHTIREALAEMEKEKNL